MATKAQILATGNRPPKRVDNVPGLEGPVYIRRLSGTDRDCWDIFQYAHADEKGRLVEGTRHVRAQLVALGVCDESGARLFSDADVAALGDQADGEVLDRLYDLVSDYNGLSKKAREETRKNSKGAPSS